MPMLTWTSQSRGSTAFCAASTTPIRRAARTAGGTSGNTAKRLSASVLTTRPPAATRGGHTGNPGKGFAGPLLPPPPPPPPPLRRDQPLHAPDHRQEVQDPVPQGQPGDPAHVQPQPRVPFLEPPQQVPVDGGD